MKTRLLQSITCSAVALFFVISASQIAGAQVLKDLGKAIENTGKGFKATGKAIEKGVEKTGDAIEKGVKKTGDAIDGDGTSSDTASSEATEGEVADGDAAGANVPTPQEKPVQKSYLFVQQAGSLKYADGKLTLGDLAPSTFFFTDRPVREAGHMTHEAYSDLWKDESEDSFKADPPNAAIAIAGHQTTDPLVVELLSAELKGNDLTYAVSVVSGDLPAEAKNIALFVDLFIVGAGAGFGSK